MTVRAKFQCVEITKRHWNAGHVWYKFNAVSADGIPENERFHKYSPSGSLEIQVDNPEVSFELGEYYYLDFNKVVNQVQGEAQCQTGECSANAVPAENGTEADSQPGQDIQTSNLEASTSDLPCTPSSEATAVEGTSSDTPGPDSSAENPPTE